MSIYCKKSVVVVWKKIAKCFDSHNPLSFEIIYKAKFELKVKEVLCIDLKNFR